MTQRDGDGPLITDHHFVESHMSPIDLCCHWISTQTMCNSKRKAHADQHEKQIGWKVRPKGEGTWLYLQKIGDLLEYAQEHVSEGSDGTLVEYEVHAVMISPLEWSEMGEFDGW